MTVVVWGEFGRTPKINKDAGRDHWARVNSCLLAGGGMKTGQVIGSTDKLGGSAVANPVHYLDVLATVYHNLGIDPHGFVPDCLGPAACRFCRARPRPFDSLYRLTDRPTPIVAQAASSGSMLQVSESYFRRTPRVELEREDALRAPAGSSRSTQSWPLMRVSIFEPFAHDLVACSTRRV